MDRRTFLQTLLAASAATTLPACVPAGYRAAGPRRVMTVNGLIDAAEMGMTLTHEHLFANLQPYKEQVSNPVRYDPDEVVEVVLPYLARIRELGCRTLIDCTATHLGRNPALIKRLSDASGLHLLTLTGNYAAAGQRFLPPYVFSDSAEALAARWIDEWHHGIEGTGIRPGLIKIAFDGGPLPPVEQKLIRAAAVAHRETGLVIGAHTGAWGDVTAGANAESAFAQLDQLEDAGVAPSAWIWMHAHNEPDFPQLVRAAQRGAWVSLDGFRPDSVVDYVNMVTRMRDEGLLHRVLVSQDAGWYTAGEPRGGDFNPFHPVFTSFIPALKEAGFTDAGIGTLFIDNPAEAFSIRVRSPAS